MVIVIPPGLIANAAWCVGFEDGHPCNHGMQIASLHSDSRKIKLKLIMLLWKINVERGLLDGVLGPRVSMVGLGCTTSEDHHIHVSTCVPFC